MMNSYIIDVVSRVFRIDIVFPVFFSTLHSEHPKKHISRRTPQPFNNANGFQHNQIQCNLNTQKQHQKSEQNLILQLFKHLKKKIKRPYQKLHDPRQQVNSSSLFPSFLSVCRIHLLAFLYFIKKISTSHCCLLQY